jgi:O-antigen ligase
VTREQAATLLERLALTLACLSLAWGPLAQGSTFGWGQSGLVLLGALTSAFALLALGVRGRLNWPGQLLGWLGRSSSVPVLWTGTALAFLLWVWASVLWAPYTAEAVRWAGVWTAVLGTGLTLLLFADSQRRQAVVLSVMVLTGAVSLGAAYLQTRGVSLPGFVAYPGVGPSLVSGPYFNPSHFSGSLIALAALITSLLLFTRPHLHTALLLGLLAALHVLDFRTDSSSIPAVLLATAWPLLVWIWTRSRRLGAVLSVLALGGALSVGGLFFTPQGQATFAQVQATIGIHRDWGSFLLQRRAVWHYGQAMWAAHPLLGAGAGQFRSEAPRFRRPERQVGSGMDQGAVNYAHNDALQLAAELGLPGALLVAGLLVLPLFSSKQAGVARVAHLSWCAALPALLLSGLYDAHLTAVPGTMMLAFGLAALAVGRPGAAVRLAARSATCTTTDARF